MNGGRSSQLRIAWNSLLGAALWYMGPSSQGRILWLVLAMCSLCDTIPMDRSTIEISLLKRQYVGLSNFNAWDRKSKDRALSTVCGG